MTKELSGVDSWESVGDPGEVSAKDELGWRQFLDARYVPRTGVDKARNGIECDRDRVRPS